MVSQIMVVTGTLVRCSKARDLVQYLRHSRSSHCRTSSSPSEIFTAGNVIKVTAVLIVAAATILTFPAPTTYTNLNVNYGPSRGGRLLPTLLDG